MQTFRNLVSDSPFVQEAVDLLRNLKGRAPASLVADAILQVPNLEPPLAALFISELIRDDWRLRLTSDYEVELDCEDDECRALDETDYIVLDLETTGAKAASCRIMEIGAYRVSGGRIVAEFETLVNPQTKIPPFVVQLTGITEAMVKDAPLFSDVAADWLKFADTAVLVAHNASFDVRFINYEVSRVFPGRRMINSQICTVTLSRSILPGLPNYRLPTLAEHFAIPIRNRHRAGGDARATAELFLRLLEVLDQHGVRDLAGARRFKRQKAEATEQPSEVRG